MDWKSYYRRDLERDEVRAALAAALSHQEDDLVRGAPGERGTILSFPHTAACYAGPLQARVGRRALPLTPRSRPGPGCAAPLGTCALSRARGRGADPRAPIARLLRPGRRLRPPPAGSARTAFGTLPLARLPRETPGVLRLDRRGILKDEFSLDLFLSLVGLYAERHGAEPLSVLPVYVGMTRNPLSGSFEGAASLARALRRF